jgi:hypothetical protein
MSDNQEQVAAQPESKGSPAVPGDLGIIGNAARTMYETRASRELAESRPEETAATVAGDDGVTPKSYDDGLDDSTDDSSDDGKTKKRSRNVRYKAQLEAARAETKNLEQTAAKVIEEKATLQAKLESMESRMKSLAQRLTDVYGEELEFDERDTELETYKAQERAKAEKEEFSKQLQNQRANEAAADYIMEQSDLAGVDAVEVATEWRTFNGKMPLSEVIQRVKSRTAPKAPPTETEVQLAQNRKAASAAPIPVGKEKPAALTAKPEPPKLTKGARNFVQQIFEQTQKE